MDSHLRNAKTLANILENKFSIFGFKFGLDPILGMVPFLGDVIGLLVSSYIIWIAHQTNVPGRIIAKMWRNIVFDFLLGSIPFIGDVSDFFYKASSKNIKLLEQHAKNKVIEVELVIS